MAGGSSTYQIHVEGILDDSQIRAKLATIESQLNKGGLAAVTGSNGKGKKGGTTVYGQAGKEAKGATKQVAGFAGATKKASVNMLDVGKKVLAFGAVTSIIQTATAGMTDMVVQVKTVDDQLTELKKVSSLSAEGLKEYTKQAGEAGKETGRTTAEMLDASTQFVKMGRSEKQALGLAKLATQFQNIADAEISAGDAALFINATMKGFGMTTVKEAEHITDAVNETANNFAFGTNDMQLALRSAATSLGVANNTFEESIGLLGAGLEMFPGQASTVGNAFNTISVKIANLAKSSDTWVAANGKVNVALKDSKGNLRSTYEIMKDLYTGVEGQSEAWANLSSSEQVAIAQSVAGLTRYKQFTSTMKNFETAIKAVDVAENSQGSAARENARAMESLDKKIQSVKAAWQKFSTSLIDSGVLKDALDSVVKVLDVLASDAGQAAIKMALLGTVSILGLKGFTKLIKVVPAATKAMKGFAETLEIINLMYATGGIKEVFSGTLGGKFSKLGKTLKTVGKFFGTKTFAAGLPVAIALASVALAKYVDIGSSRKAKQAEEGFEKSTKKAKELKKQIEANREEMKKLTDKKQASGLTDAEQLRLDILRQQTSELRSQYNLQSALSVSEANKKWETVDTSKLKGSTKKKYTAAKASGQSDESALASAGAYNDVAVAMNNYRDAANAVRDANEKVTKTQNEANDALDKYGRNSDEFREAGEKWTEALKEQSDATKKLPKETKKLQGTLDDLYSDFGGKELFDQNASKELKDWRDKLVGMIHTASGLDKLRNGAKGIAKEFKKAGKSVGIIEKKSKATGKTYAQINASKFTKGIIDAGGTKKEAKKALEEVVSSYEKSGKQVRLKVDGKDLGSSVDKAMKKLDEQGNPIKIKAKVDIDDSDANGKLKTWGGKKKIGTRTTDFKGNTKDVYGKYNTWKGTKVIGTRYVEFKAKKVGKWPEKHGTRNFQGFAKGTLSSWVNNAQVNEQGFEIIQDGKTGAMRIANAGHRGDTYLNRGDAVYTHGQSMRMLARAGLTEADILQGKTGDVGVVGVKKLEGFKKGKASARKAFKKELETLEFKRDFENWTDEKFQAEYEKLWDKYGYGFTDKKGNYTKASREYRTELAELSREQATDSIDSMMEIFENQQKTYAEMTKILEQYYEDGKINADEYAEYLKDLNEQQVENLRTNYSNQWDYISEYIQRQIDLEEENNDLLEAQSNLLSATTQKVKVYKEGIGFVYEADESAVKEAQENLKSYSSVWEQIQGVLDDVESQINLKQLATKVGSSLVDYVTGASTDMATWKNLIGLVGANMGAYDLASDLGITDPNSITKATTINGQTFNIDNISLPQVTNANEFVSELQTLAIQASASRA